MKVLVTGEVVCDSRDFDTLPAVMLKKLVVNVEDPPDQEPVKVSYWPESIAALEAVNDKPVKAGFMVNVGV